MRVGAGGWVRVGAMSGARVEARVGALVLRASWKTLTRICASLGLRVKFKTLFMSEYAFLLFLNMSNQFLAPGCLNAECVQVSVI